MKTKLSGDKIKKESRKSQTEKKRRKKFAETKEQVQGGKK